MPVIIQYNDEGAAKMLFLDFSGFTFQIQQLNVKPMWQKITAVSRDTLINGYLPIVSNIFF